MTQVFFTPGARFAIVTLGCKVNQYESHALREAWLARGLTECSDPEGADIVCINSCAVTAKAVADVRAACRRAHRAAPGAAILVTGCAAQVLRDELAALPGVSVVVPQEDKAGLLRALSAGGQTPEKPVGTQDGKDDGGSKDGKTKKDDGKDNADSGFAAWQPFAVSGYDRSRAMVKVQDGCSHRCTYCIVPLTRGPSRSREPAETLAELHRLLAAGFRELTVSGINLAQYGRDLAKPHDFWDLVAYLDRELAAEWTGRARLRLSSLEPGQLDAKALDTLGRASLIAPHLHLSLQSGSPAVLRRMGRGHYDPAKLPAFCAELAQIWPHFGLGADLLTAFPGESDEQALETEEAAKTLPLTYAHVFPYSPRPGTWAAAQPGQVDHDVKKSRAARLRRIVAGKKEAFLRACCDLPLVHVAWEGQENGGGVNEFYSDCRFAVPFTQGPEAQRSLITARPVGVEKGHLLVVPFSDGRQ